MSTNSAPPDDYEAAAQRRLAMLGCMWFLVVRDMKEITKPIAEVYEQGLWSNFYSPTFVDAKRVRALTRLDDGSFRAMVTTGNDSHRSELLLGKDATLECLIHA